MASINDNALKMEVNQGLPLNQYFRIAQSLLRQAGIYRDENNHIELYISLLRFSSLVTDTIPYHKDYRRPSAEKTFLLKKAPEVLAELERLKPTVQQEWRRIKDSVQQDTSAQQEIVCLKKYDPSECRRSFTLKHPSEEAVSRHSYFTKQHYTSKTETFERPVKVQYPSRIEISDVEIPSLDQNWRHVSSTAPATPIFHSSQFDLLNQLSPLPVAAPVGRLQLKPSQVADPRPGPARSSQQKGPKSLYISTKMMDDFLSLARLNTEKNLETCGVLAGSLVRGIFSVTTLIVPKQEATSDSCQTVNEEELFDIQDQRNLFQVGWIHTHPSQSCFMSSIDLHTHYSYQVMLQEAVAIVMAPTDAERKFGIFRLSEPSGMKMIQQCDERGFHPHEEPADGSAIYDHCSHVYMNPSLKFDVIDLRTK